MIASHELCIPLTTVPGYIELLDQYHEKLEVESRAEFIEKARCVNVRITRAGNEAIRHTAKTV
ncbi:hypothetical protein KSZ_42150 [Dictyobacter formicarum]|uniref:Signal transduction histidine kinase dimerisation/phosphoacceptor domain-containing protein n=1 Tax=Dictyobacter formicarum TaxID=2778368 RepID=A0ABQ3VKJ8_9CHLR|nr:hypothetical protein KSZ_42150 [Dictyobacter formicarum]